MTGDQLAQLMFPRFDDTADAKQIGKGMNASPGAAVGKAVFDSYTAVKWSRSGEKVILVRRETNPDDLDGMIAAQGILTSRGGKTTHAAVVARGMGKTCVCGAEELDVDTKKRRLTVGDIVVEEGDVLSIDGTSRRGLPRRGRRSCPRRSCEYFEGSLDPDSADADELVKAVHRLMTARRRGAPAAGARQRRHPGGRGAGPPVRRRRASGCAAPSTCSSATAASTSSG